jgi:hypothetical protein
MPFAGFRNNTSSTLNFQGSYGIYWMSSPFVHDLPEHACNLIFNSSSVDVDNKNRRATGETVRCFKDLFEKPTSSWTVIT